MTTTSTKSLLLQILPAALLALGTASGLAQGSLTPGGGPAPSMKTLQQIEPRTPISSLPFTITESGSYYLTGNLTGASNSHGILILTNHVTVDLGGFTLAGVPGSRDGINVGNGGEINAVNITNVVLRNGFIRNWGGNGVAADKITGGRLEGVHAVTNGAIGLSLGSDMVARDCQAHFNRNDGIAVNTGNNVILEACLAAHNGLDGFHVNGSLVRHCVSRNNGYSGFSVFGRSVITDSRSDSNHRSGIEAGIDCQILRNHCGNNNVANAANAAGIRAFSSGCRIEANHVQYGNNFGILVDGGLTDTVIIRNTTHGVPANSHSVPAGNDVGPWGQASTATSPWANIRN